MLILTIRTDKPESEIGLYEETHEVAYQKWEAHRQLSETIHTRIKHLLGGKEKDWQDIEGIVCFKGPGSFTGLRIGLTVGNSLSAGLGAPIIAVGGEKWKEQGIESLLAGKGEKIATPDYGREARITLPRK